MTTPSLSHRDDTPPEDTDIFDDEDLDDEDAEQVRRTSRFQSSDAGFGDDLVDSRIRSRDAEDGDAEDDDDDGGDDDRGDDDDERDDIGLSSDDDDDSSDGSDDDLYGSDADMHASTPDEADDGDDDEDWFDNDVPQPAVREDAEPVARQNVPPPRSTVRKPSVDLSAVHEEPGVDLLPAVLSCEAGRLSLTVQAVRQLQTGQVLDLGRAVLDGVNLILEGREVARGMLVEVDGRFGIMLTSLSEEGQHG